MGRVLSAQVINVGTDSVQAILDFLKPTTIEKLESVLGKIFFVRKFVPNFTAEFEPLVSLQ